MKTQEREGTRYLDHILQHINW